MLLSRVSPMANLPAEEGDQTDDHQDALSDDNTRHFRGFDKHERNNYDPSHSEPNKFTACHRDIR